VLSNSFGQSPKEINDSEISNQSINNISLIILGTLQDAGSPHIACEKDCCANVFENSNITRKVVSLGVIDQIAEKTYLFEATPDITSQLRSLRLNAEFKTTDIPDGIFLTHAHVGHYTGLMYLGKEATNAKQVSVYAMPRMKSFLEKNGPWSQLVTNSNISLKPLTNGEELQLTEQLKVVPFTVPHRDEFSETVGYKIIGPNKRALFIPDIDKWDRWKTSVIDEIAKVDYAFLDATFYDAEEINNRDMSEIPHPFVLESMSLFRNLPSAEKRKIHFIHFNHTNPLLREKSDAHSKVLENGFNVARIHHKIEL
jgi:pyrroloquinoline quinone biosynthesis protein B